MRSPHVQKLLASCMQPPETHWITSKTTSAHFFIPIYSSWSLRCWYELTDIKETIRAPTFFIQLLFFDPVFFKISAWKISFQPQIFFFLNHVWISHCFIQNPHPFCVSALLYFVSSSFILCANGYLYPVVNP